MEAADRLAVCLGGELANAVRENAGEIRELRVRAEKPARLILMDGSEICLKPVTSEEMRRMIARMTEDSLYACEPELMQGYFTMAGGIRVGVCGRLNAENGRVASLSCISSFCARLPRQIIGCAEALMNPGRPESLLIISPPGLGKTTIIRDLARLVSEAGWNVAIADERREIAACREGIPYFDLGPRTDVMDGCPKRIAISLLLRSCAPDMIVADEIGGLDDEIALREAARCGVSVAASAHAAGFREAEARFGKMLGEVFSRLVLLGPKPGQIREIREYNCEGANDAERLYADAGAGGKCLRGENVIQRKKAQGGNAG